MNQTNRYWQAKKITLIGGLVNTLLGVGKIVGGILFHSHALVADGIHSFADLISDAMVLIASKYGSLEADDSHPYGHKRIETAATLFLSLLLIAAGIGIAWDAISELLRGEHTKPMAIAVGIAFSSIIANELLFFATRKVGMQIQSDLIIANAWHHRADSGASFVVVVGILGSLMGFIYSDALAAIIVSLLVIKMGVEYAWQSIHELIDSGVDAETLEQITRSIHAVDGILKIHQLRTRKMGADVYIDVHIIVHSLISVSEGHYIAQKLHHYLMHSLPHVRDVTVHVDAEDDEKSSPSLHLPDRTQLNEKLFNNWHSSHHCLKQITLHYLNGELHIELLCQGRHEQIQLFQKTVIEDIKKVPEITKVILLESKELHLDELILE